MYLTGEDVVLAITIPRATRYQKPVYINNDVFGSTFRRDHEGDYRCTEAEVKAMIRDSSEETPDERVLTRKPDFDPDMESMRDQVCRISSRHGRMPDWMRLSLRRSLVAENPTGQY